MRRVMRVAATPSQNVFHRWCHSNQLFIFYPIRYSKFSRWAQAMFFITLLGTSQCPSCESKSSCLMVITGSPEYGKESQFYTLVIWSVVRDRKARVHWGTAYSDPEHQYHIMPCNYSNPFGCNFHGVGIQRLVDAARTVSTSQNLYRLILYSLAGIDIICEMRHSLGHQYNIFENSYCMYKLLHVNLVKSTEALLLFMLFLWTGQQVGCTCGRVGLHEYLCVSRTMTITNF